MVHFPKIRFPSLTEDPKPRKFNPAIGQDLADRIRSIVADGGDIRENIADAVRQAVAMVQETGESLGEVSKTVMDEALGAANEEAGKRHARSRGTRKRATED